MCDAQAHIAKLPGVGVPVLFGSDLRLVVPERSVKLESLTLVDDDDEEEEKQSYDVSLDSSSSSEEEAEGKPGAPDVDPDLLRLLRAPAEACWEELRDGSTALAVQPGLETIGNEKVCLRDVVAVEENLEHLDIKSRMVHGTLDMVEPLISSICRLDIEAPSDVSGK